MASWGSILREIFSSRNMKVIAITQSMFMFSVTLWWPFWSLYIVGLGATKVQLGLVYIVEMSTQILSQLPGGVLSDRLGRKKVIVVSSIFRPLSMVVYLATKSWFMIIPGVFLGMLYTMLNPAVDAMIAESMPLENRSAAYGVYRLMSWIPRSFTALLGGIIVDYLGVIPGVRFCLTLTFIVTFSNIFIRWRFLEDTYLSEARDKDSREGLREGLRALKNVPNMIWLLIVIACISSFSVWIVHSLMAVYVTEAVGLSSTQWGLISTVVNIVATLLTLPSGILSDRYGRKPIIIVSRVLQPIQMLGFSLSNGFWGVFASRMLGGISEGFGGTVMGVVGGPTWQALVADIVPQDKRGSIMGLTGTLTGILNVPGPWLGGYLYEQFSPSTPYHAAFISGSIATALFILLVKEPDKKVK